MDFLRLLAQRSQPATAKRFDPNLLNDDTIDPAVRIDHANDSMQSELRDRIFQNERLDNGPEVKALSRLLGSYQAERDNSELTDQRHMMDQQNALMRDSINSGFTGGAAKPANGRVGSMNPIQEREIYRREQAEKNSDYSLHSMQEQGLDRRQANQIQATQKQVETQMAPAMRQADAMAGYYDSLTNGGTDPSQIRSITRNGVTFQPTPKPQPAISPQMAQAQRDLIMSRNSMGNVDPFANPQASDSAHQAFFQNARNVLNASGLHPDTQAAIYDYLIDPNDDNGMPQTFEDAFAGHEDDPEYAKARQLVLLIRGSFNAAQQK